MRAAQQEGLLAARYEFVHIIFNGKDKGIYALQEQATQDLLAAQGCPPGVIAKFDTRPLLESLAAFHGDAETAFSDPVAELSPATAHSLGVNTLQETRLGDENDPALSLQQEQAAAMLYALQANTRPASQIFDTTQYGRFLALVDLWNAPGATSVLNLKYYYNPVTEKLEPIIFNANALSNTGRLSLDTACCDPEIAASYAQEALRLSNPAYIEALQEMLEPEWQQLSRAFKEENRGTPVPPWEALQVRQEALRQSLNPTQPVLAYLLKTAPETYAVLQIGIGNPLNLPLEIVGLDVNGTTFLDLDPAWLYPTSEDLLIETPGGALALCAFGTNGVQHIQYARFDIPLAAIHAVDAEANFNGPLNIQVVTRIWGLDTPQFTPVRYGMPDPIFIEAHE